MELRAVIARLVMGFDVEFAEGERGEKLLGRELGLGGGEQDTKEVFTLDLGELRIRFQKRK